jgi:hypothetical protein
VILDQSNLAKLLVKNAVLLQLRCLTLFASVTSFDTGFAVAQRASVSSAEARCRLDTSCGGPTRPGELIVALWLISRREGR